MLNHVSKNVTHKKKPDYFCFAYLMGIFLMANILFIRLFFYTGNINYTYKLYDTGGQMGIFFVLCARAGSTLNANKQGSMQQKLTIKTYITKCNNVFVRCYVRGEISVPLIDSEMVFKI